MVSMVRHHSYIYLLINKILYLGSNQTVSNFMFLHKLIEIYLILYKKSSRNRQIWSDIVIILFPNE